MPKVPEAYLDARRTQIVETASRIYREKGFKETQMREIAEAAGLSTGALYRYFASKEELFRALIEAQRPAEEAFRDKVFGDGSPSERLQRLPAQLVALASETRSRYHFRDYGEAATIPFLQDMLTDHVAELTDVMVELVLEAQATGDIDPTLDPQMTASAILNITLGIDFTRLFDDHFNAPRLTEVLQKMIAGLGT